MSRSLAMLFFTTFVLGCHSQSGNPFMRTTVPPPATGAGAPTDPYYNNSGASQPPPISAPQTVPAPGPTATTPAVPPPEKRYTAPGGYNFPQGSINHRKAVDPSPNDYRAGASAIARAARPRNKVAPSSRDSAIATTEITPENAPLDEPSDRSVTAARYSRPEPVGDREGAGNQPREDDEVANGEIDSQPLVGTGDASLRIVTSEASADERIAEPKGTSIEPTNLVARSPSNESPALVVAPPVAADSSTNPAAQLGGSSRDGSSNQNRHYFDRPRPASRADANPAASAGNPGSATLGVNSGPDSAPAYSHHTSYSWLRGKLEYSTAARRWKLRYIPIDGQTDPFGGSVVLANSPLLEQLRPGQMVTAEGVIGNSPAEHGSYSPLFDLRSIKSQR